MVRVKISKKKCVEDPRNYLGQFIMGIATVPDNFSGLLRQACLMEITDGEIQNGGFWQYFHNNDEYLDHTEVARAFEDLGAHDHSVLFLAAITVFKAKQVLKTRSKAAKETKEEELDEKMEDLEQKYYDLPDITDLLEKILKQRESELVEWID